VKRLVGSASVALVVLTVAACGSSSSTSGSGSSSSSSSNAAAVGSSGAAKKCNGTITVGAPLPITGTLAYYGTNYQRGFQLAVKHVNSTGGIDGCKLAVEYTDTQGDLSQSEAAVRRYHSQGIKAIIGTSSSTTDGPDSALANELGMIGWVVGVDSTITSRGLKLVVDPAVYTPNFIKPVFVQFANIAKQLNKPVSQIKVALVYSNDAYGTSNSAAEKAELNAMHVPIVGSFPYDIASTNLTPTVLAIQKSNPTVVIQTGYTDDIVSMWTDAKAVHYAPPYFIGAGGTASSNFNKALGSFGNGFIAYDYALPTPKIPASETFAQQYQQAYGEPLPSGHALMAYSSLLMLADAMRKAGGGDPSAVVAAAHAMNEPPATYPDGCGFKLNSGGQNIECFSNAFEWKNGKLTTIWPAASANGSFFGPIAASKANG
jgi:branched-chain amino acid transport system substrate-binding protein